MRPTTTLLVACFILLGLGPTVVAGDEPSSSGSTGVPCVDVKPDSPTDPIDIYDCDPEGEP